MIPCCYATTNRYKRVIFASRFSLLLELLLLCFKTWSHKWLNLCSEGGITSGKVETRMWGEKKLFHMGQLLTDSKREGITASVKAAYRVCWWDASAPEVTCSTFSTVKNKLKAYSESYLSQWDKMEVTFCKKNKVIIIKAGIWQGNWF